MTFVIDRSKLLTGTALHKYGNGAGTLLNSAGLLCCLGQYCLDHGLLPSDIQSHAVPTSCAVFPSDSRWLQNQLEKKDQLLGMVTVEDAIADTNDNSKLHPKRREARIAKLFKKYGGIDVTFIGRYADATKKARDYARRNSA